MIQQLLRQMKKCGYLLCLLMLLAACRASSTVTVNTASSATPRPAAPTRNETITPIAATLPPPNTPPGSMMLYTHNCGLYTIPPVAALDDPAMRSIYSAVTDCASDLGRYLIGYAPLLSPDARRLLITNPYETWVADFTTGKSHRLLLEQVAATWNPSGTQIAYVSDDKLYTWALDSSNPAEVLFRHENLNLTVARWSPDGEWIATLTITNSLDGDASMARVWVIPVQGGTVQELGSFAVPPIEFAPQDVRWSPDSQTIGVWAGWLFPLKGDPQQTDLNKLSWWESAQARQLIGNQVDPKWAFSHDGQRLAYAQPAVNGTEIWTVTIASGSATRLGSITSAAAPRVIRWSLDDNTLFIGLNDATIWSMPAKENRSPVMILTNGELIDLIPFVTKR